MATPPVVVPGAGSSSASGIIPVVRGVGTIPSVVGSSSAPGVPPTIHAEAEIDSLVCRGFGHSGSPMEVHGESNVDMWYICGSSEPSFETFTSLENSVFVGVCYDNIRYFDMNAGMLEKANLIVYPMGGTSGFVDTRGGGPRFISDDKYYIAADSTSSEITYVGDLPNFRGVTNSGTFVCDDALCLGMDLEYGWVDLSSILNSGEYVVDCIDTYDVDGSIVLVLTDQRIIKLLVPWEGDTVVQGTVPLSGGLMFTFPDYRYYDYSYMGIITSTGDFVVFGYVETVSIESVEAMPLYVDFIVYCGYIVGGRVPYAVLSQFSDNPFGSCIEIVQTPGGDVALYSNKVSSYNSIFEETVLLESLPQADPHHLNVISTSRPA